MTDERPTENQRRTPGVEGTIRQIAASDADLVRRLAEIGLDDFETCEECSERNNKMFKRLYPSSHPRRGIVAHGRRQVYEPIIYADGDWLASREHRLNLIPQAYDLLSAHRGPLYFATIAHPRWQVPLDQLAKANIAAALQWLRRRTGGISDLIVVGGFEPSVRVELIGAPCWSGHLHLVVAGVERPMLRSALRLQPHLRHRGARPVTVEDVVCLARCLGYATKRIGTRSVAYVGENGRQQRRNLPLNTEEQNEFDRWLLGLPLGSRTILMGCRLHNGKLRKVRSAV